MESILPFFEQYKDHKILQQLQDFESSNVVETVEIQGLKGALFSVIGAISYHHNPHPRLILLPDKEEASYCYSNLKNLLPKAPIWFLPDQFKKPGDYLRIYRGHLQQRTEVVQQLYSNVAKAPIIVSYPEALFEKVLSPAELETYKIEVKKSERLDIEFFREVLIEYRFTAVDFVYEPGEFSVRGDIIDVYSYGNEYPYRIELFDEEVESIRLYDPASQLSIKEISSIHLIPDVQKTEQIEAQDSFFSVLPDHATIWTSDLDLFMERYSALDERMEQHRHDALLIEDESIKKFYNEKPVVSYEAIKSTLANYAAVLEKSSNHLTSNRQLNWSSSPQPNFNKNFSLLIENLQEWAEKSYELFLFTDNARQVNRINAIFQDLNAKVVFNPVLKGLSEGFIDHESQVVAYTDHQIFDRYYRYQMKRGFHKGKALNLKFVRQLVPGDFVTHIDHGVGRYSGLEKIDINGKTQETLRIIYKNNDILYVSINSLHKLSKFIGKDGNPPAISKLGSDTWKKLKSKTKKKLKDIAADLIKLYARRKAAQGYAFGPDGYLQNELEASFIYEDTPDQYSSTVSVKEDMEKPYPMDRLICGDVGFGKTEIAIRATFKAVVHGKQVAILVPTTILALQHYKTFSKRLEDFGIKVDYVNRFKSTAEKNELYRKLESGEVEVVIGTHALLNKKVKFKDLGLLVVDEEQKFGVSAKEKLRNFKANVDTLTLTATPIPRTLQFSLMGARDLSVIRTPPPNRQPIHTEIRIIHEELIKDAIFYEIERGGQVFFVHNRVKSLPDMQAMLARICPDVDISMAHGQMEAKQLEKRLLDFIEGKIDVLLCTNIIETGLDIPNANTIIINNAHQFGLSDLHQLRGRVGRSNKKAFCYLFSPPLSTLTPEARKRLKTIEDFSDLGSGFEIAMRDLDIRGAGNLLGAEQSGFISDIGYQTYQKILEEALNELKHGEFKELYEEEIQAQRNFVSDLTVETDSEMLIPDTYVNQIQERLNLYTELNALKDEEELAGFQERLDDRFGPPPPAVFELFTAIRLQWLGRKYGFEKISLKGGKLRCFFVSDPQSSFYESAFFIKLLGEINKYSKKRPMKLKQGRKQLLIIVDQVKDLQVADKLLKELYEQVDV